MRRDDAVDDLRITMSLGVAVYDRSTAQLLTQPEMVVRMADRAVYAAKGSGRNCVRVFAPARHKTQAAR